jgi:hypothetical protein
VGQRTVKKDDKPNPNDDQRAGARAWNRSEQQTSTRNCCSLNGGRAPGPGITEQITRLLPEVYAGPCDIEDLKARCGFNDEQLLKGLARLRQGGVVVDADALVGLLAAALCSPE